jgi:hypothetical protein
MRSDFRSFRWTKRARGRWLSRWSRVVVAMIAGAAATIVGFQVRPGVDGIPTPLRGSIVLLTSREVHDANLSVSVQAEATTTTVFDSRRDEVEREPIPETNILTVAGTPANSGAALGPAAPSAVWIILLLGFPQATLDRPVPEGDTWVELRTRTGIQTAVAGPRAAHDYAIVGPPGRAGIVVTLRADQEAWFREDTYATVAFPSAQPLQNVTGASGDPRSILERTYENLPPIPSALSQALHISVDYGLQLPEGASGTGFSPVSGSIPLDPASGVWHWKPSQIGDESAGPVLVVRDLEAADTREARFFWAGLVFGVAAGAVLTALVELAGALWADAEKPEPRS